MFEALFVSWPIALLGLILVGAGALTLRAPTRGVEDQPSP
jgi:hypothetical protein